MFRGNKNSTPISSPWLRHAAHALKPHRIAINVAIPTQMFSRLPSLLLAVFSLVRLIRVISTQPSEANRAGYTLSPVSSCVTLSAEASSFTARGF